MRREGEPPPPPAPGPCPAHLGDLHPLTVGAWIISSRALKPSSCPDELTTTNPILWGILGAGPFKRRKLPFKRKGLSNVATPAS